MDEYVAQLERQPDGVLMAVLYRNGRRAHAELVRSVRQGRRRAHDLLCTAVDTAGRAFPGLPTDRQAKNRVGVDRNEAASALAGRRSVFGIAPGFPGQFV